MKNFNDLIKNFFETNNVGQMAARVSVVRNDGIILYSNINDYLEASSIGALTGGLWQAAQALSSLATNNTSESEGFRLSFDTTNQGLYILPFKIDNKEYFLCSIYEDVVNPGLLKRDFRNIKDRLVNYIKENEIKTVEIKSGFLFNNITDAEMDNLFSATGL